jgi:hypothetical protein
LERCLTPHRRSLKPVRKAHDAFLSGPHGPGPAASDGMIWQGCAVDVDGFNKRALEIEAQIAEQSEASND